MTERHKFILAQEEGLFSTTELCERFGISRKPGYKWLNRYRDEGARACATAIGVSYAFPSRITYQTYTGVVVSRPSARTLRSSPIREMPSVSIQSAGRVIPP